MVSLVVTILSHPYIPVVRSLPIVAIHGIAYPITKQIPDHIGDLVASHLLTHNGGG